MCYMSCFELCKLSKLSELRCITLSCIALLSCIKCASCVECICWAGCLRLVYFLVYLCVVVKRVFVFVFVLVCGFVIVIVVVKHRASLGRLSQSCLFSRRLMCGGEVCQGCLTG